MTSHFLLAYHSATDEGFDPTSKHAEKSSSYFCTAKAVNVEIDCKVLKLEVVGNCSENLKTKIVAETDGVADGKESRRSGAADKEKND